MVQRQWPAFPEATPQSLAYWAREITKLMQQNVLAQSGDLGTMASQDADDVDITGGSIDGVAITGSTFGGFPLSASGNRYGAIPFVGNDGVMEVGRYIDFHNSDADTGDAANRLETNGGTVGLFESPNLGGLKRIVSLTNSTLAQGDVIYYDGTNFVRLAPGTSGHFLKTNGAAANPAWTAVTHAVTPVAQGAISSAATLDIPLGSADMYEIDLVAFVPQTDTVSLHARLSQSSSFLTGASDYAYGMINALSDRADFANDFLLLADAGDLGNAANEHTTITIRVFRPSAAAFKKSLLWHGYYCEDSARISQVNGGGQLIANTNAIDGIRIYYESGNIASGYYAVRSYSYT